MRVFVSGGGCSGFQYKFDMDRQQAPDDVVVARDGARVLIDQVSVKFLAGSEIDFVDRNEDLQELLRRLKQPVQGTQYFLPLGSAGTD